MATATSHMRSFLACILVLCSAERSLADGGKYKHFPAFGEADNSVTVREGATARLPCVVLHLNDKSSDRRVIWLRRRDLHILTVGHLTYSADDRFQVVHSDNNNEWTLIIQYAQLRDAGIYECQINTEPKLSRPVTLTVYDSSQEITITKTKVFVANNTASTKDGHLRVEILGPRERYINEGSSLTLICLVTSSFGPSTLVYWYHETKLLDQNSPRGGIKIKINHASGETTSRLKVTSVERDDGGMYFCVPSGSHPASVLVHVTHDGENEAVIQQGGLEDKSSFAVPAPSSLPFIIPFLLLLLLALPSLLFEIPARFPFLPLVPLVPLLPLLLLPPLHAELRLLPLLLACHAGRFAGLQVPYFRRLFRRILDAARDSGCSFFCLCVAASGNAVVNMPSLGNIVSLCVPGPVASFFVAFSFSLLFNILISSFSLYWAGHCVGALLLKPHCFVVDESCSSGRLCRPFPAAGHHDLTFPEQFQLHVPSIIDCAVPCPSLELYHCSPSVPSSLFYQNDTLSLAESQNRDSY
ncbi:uncharacterized protein LOC122247873 [Penaeus japonicus]|uniref:uncharacterized protein LOC122247873 n=1 Tax=Penaeus japonicus TaxID=27405 RepID=UPI001C70EE6D|nr:uncharacterized protein LOC122247873 [Penaeus japonicus]